MSKHDFFVQAKQTKPIDNDRCTVNRIVNCTVACKMTHWGRLVLQWHINCLLQLITIVISNTRVIMPLVIDSTIGKIANDWSSSHEFVKDSQECIN